MSDPVIQDVEKAAADQAAADKAVADKAAADTAAADTAAADKAAADKAAADKAATDKAAADKATADKAAADKAAADPAAALTVERDALKTENETFKSEIARLNGLLGQAAKTPGVETPPAKSAATAEDWLADEIRKQG